MKKACDILTQIRESLPNKDSLPKITTSHYKILLSEILNRDLKNEFIKNIDLTTSEEERFSLLLMRLFRGEPISKIVQRQEFYGFLFYVNNDVLDPRSDTETLIDAVLLSVPVDKKIKILDLGVGSGCLLISLLKKLPNSNGVGVDISSAALDVAKKNAAALGVETKVSFINSNWCDVLPRDQTFDLVISNPPYIKTTEIDLLDDSVKKYDPLVALDGGRTGLACYERIFQEIPPFLNKEAQIFVEIGYEQSYDVSCMASVYGFRVNNTFHDLCGVERVLSLGLL